MRPFSERLDPTEFQPAVLSRLAPVHKGHRRLIESVAQCTGQLPVVLLGSSNAFPYRPPQDDVERSAMLRTPFGADQRQTWLFQIFPGIQVLELPDCNLDARQHGRDPSPWLAQIRALQEKVGRPFLFHGGSQKDLLTLTKGGFPTKVTVDRDKASQVAGISGTGVRAAIAMGDKGTVSAMTCVDPNKLIKTWRRNMATMRG